MRDFYKALRQMGYRRTHTHRSWNITCVTYANGNTNVQLWSDGQHRACAEYGRTTPTGFTKLEEMQVAIADLQARAKANGDKV